MIDVTVVGGFLGAGKTTWLSRVLEENASSNGMNSLAVVVNDYASVGVDDWLLDDALGGSKGMSIRLVAGGCVCCDKMDELVSCLISLVGSAHKGGDPTRAGVSHIYIETSGVADPRPIVEVITAHPVLQSNLALKELIVVVDGVNGRSQLRHQKLARDQVSRADRIVLSKMDLAPENTFSAVAALVARLNPTAGLSGAIDGHESALTAGQLSLIQEAYAVEKNDHRWGPESFNPEAWTVQLSSQVSWAEYALWLDALTRAHPQRVLRSKGTIHTPNGPIVLQSIGGVIAQPQPVPVRDRRADIQHTTMVFITQGLDHHLLARSLHAFVPSASLHRGQKKAAEDPD